MMRARCLVCFTLVHETCAAVCCACCVREHGGWDSEGGNVTPIGRRAQTRKTAWLGRRAGMMPTAKLIVRVAESSYGRTFHHVSMIESQV